MSDRRTKKIYASTISRIDALLAIRRGAVLSSRTRGRAWGGFVAARTTLSGIGFAREYAYIEPTPMRRMIAES